MPNLYAQYLQTMGIDIWVQRHAVALESAHHHATIIIDESITPQEDKTLMPETEITQAVSLPEEKTFDQTTWETLQQQVASCTACELCHSRTQTVFGSGNPQADLMIVGEAPGADEDAKGLPFVGRAGKLLDSMLYAIDLPREEIFIANILKCRPPNNRNPTPDEKHCCTPFLKQQIALIKPKIILALGAVASNYLLNCDVKIGELRRQAHRQLFTYEETGIPLLPTYHPAYLLRSPKQKRAAWQDLQLARQTFNKQI